MKRQFKILIYFAFASILILTACTKNKFDKIATGAWNPNLAVPLAHANFDVYDVLARQDSSDLVVIDETTGAVALVYKNEIYSYGAESLIDIQDVNQSESFDLNDLNVPPSPNYNASASSNNSQSIVFDINGSELHEAKLKTGTISLNVSTNLAHDLTSVITFPEITKNGIPVTTTVSLNYSGSVPQSDISTLDLSGAIADFTRGNTTFNEIEATIETTISGTGQPIQGSESIDLEFGFNNLAFENAKGYFNQSDLGISTDSVLLKLFQNSADGYFELINPKINFIADNSFGFPIRFNFIDLQTINVNTGAHISLSGYPNSFDILSASAMGETTTSQLELNTSNTNNLSSLVTSVPKFFVYSANAEVNPNGNVPPLNFVTDESQLKIRTEVELPLEGSAYGFALKDTVDFNFNEDIEEIESVMFRLNIDNGFPVSMKTKIVFLDENYNPLFTVFDTPESIVASALVDNTGLVNQRTKKITDVTLNKDQILLLPNAKHLLFDGVSQTLNGPSGQVVKIYDDYTIEAKLGLQVKGKVQL